MTSMRTVVQQHALLLYFVLAFAISWGGMVAVAGPSAFPLAEDERGAGGMMPLGPAIAGVLMIALVSGKTGLRDLRGRLFNWRVSPRWYLIALLTVPVIYLITQVPLAVRSRDYLPSADSADDLLPAVLFGLMGGIFVGVGEELGWTGFATPRLRLRHGLLTAALILGVVHGAWHFLLFWEDDTFSGTIPFALLIVRLFAWLPALRILLLWLYERTRSVLLVMLMHATATTITLVATELDAKADIYSILVGLAVPLWILALLVVARMRTEERRPPLATN